MWPDLFLSSFFMKSMLYFFLWISISLLPKKIFFLCTIVLLQAKMKHSNFFPLIYILQFCLGKNARKYFNLSDGKTSFKKQRFQNSFKNVNNTDCTNALKVLMRVLFWHFRVLIMHTFLVLSNQSISYQLSMKIMNNI